MGITFAVDKWMMGGGEAAIYLGWEGWVAERAHGICATLPLLFCPSRKKTRNGNCEQGCEGKLITKNPSLSG